MNTGCETVAVYDEYVDLLKKTVIKGNVTPEYEQELMAPIRKNIDELQPENKKLYRYRACESRNFDALLNNRIYFNTPKNFNDPHDSFFYVDREKFSSILSELKPESIIRDILETRSSTHFSPEKISPNSLLATKVTYDYIKSMNDADFAAYLERIQKNYSEISKLKSEISQIIKFTQTNNLKQAREKTYIACLSEKIDSTLMWAHYADYHKGFAIEYSSEELSSEAEKCSREHFFALLPVAYSKKQYDATEYEKETLWFYINRYYGIDVDFCTPDKLFNIKVNSIKGPDWSYEKEWRLILYPCSSNQKTPGCITLKPTAIYLGSNISSSNEQIIRKLIEGKNLHVYRMYVDEKKDTYALSYK